MSKGIKIVTIGGGSSYTPELAEGIINRIIDGKFKVDEWWLVDIDEDNGPEKLRIITALIKRMFKAKGLETKIMSTLDRVEALKGGADFVTTQLRVGRLPARAQDERIPLSNGFIGQETNGAGGLFKGLRTIPVILSIVEDVKKYADKAWIVNFTNPSGMVTQAVALHGNYEKFVGVCNVPINTRIGVSNYLGVDYKTINMNAAGLNHFVYFNEFWHDGKHITDQILTAAKDPKEFTKFQPENIKGAWFEANLIEQLEAIPCGYHRYYYNSGKLLKEYIKHFESNTTRAEEVMKLEDSLFKKYEDVNLDHKPEELQKRGGAYYSEVAVSVIEAIHNDTGAEYVVSTINKGHVKNWDEGLVVETTSKITANGPMPVDGREVFIPEHALPHVKLIKEFELLAIKSAVNKDPKAGLMALQINPLSEDSFVAKKVFNELVDAHQQYLPGFDKVK